MKNLSLKQKRLLAYLISFVVGCLFSLVIFWVRDLFKQTELRNIYWILSDGFFFSGVLIFGSGMILGIIGTTIAPWMQFYMYPTDGYKYSCSAQLFSGSEEYKSATDAQENSKNNTDTWLQFKGNVEKYFQLRKNIALGTFAELLYSTRKFNENYTISLIEAPVFQPTPHSKTVFNGAFSANQYGAIGIIPIYKFSNSVHVRGEGYWFIPYKMIMLIYRLQTLFICSILMMLKNYMIIRKTCPVFRERPKF